MFWTECHITWHISSACSCCESAALHGPFFAHCLVRVTHEWKDLGIKGWLILFVFIFYSVFTFCWLKLNFKGLSVGFHVCVIAYLFTCFFLTVIPARCNLLLCRTLCLVQFVPQGTLPSSPFSAVITESNTNKFMSAWSQMHIVTMSEYHIASDWERV